MSRELDAEIAKLTGVKRRTILPDGSSNCIDPSYSTDMNCAMELAIEMRGEGMLRGMHPAPNNQWRVEIDDGSFIGIARFWAGTLAEAICKAYLAYKGKDND